MKEIIVEQISDLKERFEGHMKLIIDKQAEQEKIIEEITSLQNEQRGMQGEFRALIALGNKAGLVFDQDGNVIEQTEEKE